MMFDDLGEEMKNMTSKGFLILFDTKKIISAITQSLNPFNGFTWFFLNNLKKEEFDCVYFRNFHVV